MLYVTIALFKTISRSLINEFLNSALCLRWIRNVRGPILSYYAIIIDDLGSPVQEWPGKNVWFFILESSVLYTTRVNLFSFSFQSLSCKLNILNQQIKSNKEQIINIEKKTILILIYKTTKCFNWFFKQ